MHFVDYFYLLLCSTRLEVILSGTLPTAVENPEDFQRKINTKTLQILSRDKSTNLDDLKEFTRQMKKIYDG